MENYKITRKEVNQMKANELKITDIRVADNAVTVRKSTLYALDICVPSDISSAAYFNAPSAMK